MAAKQIPYTEKQLLDRSPQPPLTGRQLDEVAFPLGGIGTGSVSLGGWGQLRDWEIRNRPAKGAVIPEAFFTLKARWGRQSVTKVLQGPVGGSYVGDGHTAPRAAGEGLPHFRRASFSGQFPLATVALDDPTVPLDVSIEAFNPFIPLNDRDSSIPIAILLFHLRNRSKQAVTATVFGNLTNVIGDPKAINRTNAARRSRGIVGLFLTTDGEDEAPGLGSMALATPWEEASIWPRWKDARISKFWEAVAESDQFPPRGRGHTDTGTVAATCRLRAGETVAIPFLIAWYFPVFEHWHKPEDGDPARWRNYYASLWSDAWDVAAYTGRELERLYHETALFKDTLFASTLPTYVLDAVSSQISTLKTPTCLRLEDGTLYGFEGCSNTAGCCEGSCTHVWNYAQALPYLFPALQRSMREAEWDNSMQEDGFVTFRMPLPLGTKAEPTFHPAADGQMGAVMQAYREWLICGDHDWLRRIWPKAKRALEFAWRYWDADRDGVMEGMQHNTYDIEFYGPNTMMGSLYLGALRAAARMADAVGEPHTAKEYRALAERGAKWTDSHLFNGEYYEQKVNPRAHEPWPEHLRALAERYGRDDRFPWPKWQFGKGCISDQLIGQWYAEMLGLGYLYERGHVRKALQSIFKYNWRPDLSDHPCLLRIYAINDEAGLLIGTWPKGGRPGYAFYFADEVWCGIEYQVASHLIYEGFIKEGLAIAKGVRDRHTGERRNPWDEFECGHHYARSMASYALLLALSGFSYSAPEGRIGFAPRVFSDDFAAFFSVDSGWGQYSQKVKRNSADITLDVRHGALSINSLETDLPREMGATAKATLGGRRIPVSTRADARRLIFTFEQTVDIEPGRRLRIRT
ncbi:MAG: GH116 family glycosyl hydrolase [Armatimonadota bacterium]